MTGGLSRPVLRVLQVALLVLILVVWWWASLNRNIAFFFGQPIEVAKVIWAWFVTDASIYRHLWITLTETVLAFIIGTVGGLAFGLWLGLSRSASALLEPYVTAANSMPRVILAPIFAMWFGLGIWSK
ncbi:MAG TPA: ABC transporter permease, partial [Castellaniella sp.]|nr:ABC transporter permease [Castellaniella sp.]